jgi:hypothetical protein
MYRVYGSLKIPDSYKVIENVSVCNYFGAKSSNELGFLVYWRSEFNYMTRCFEIEGLSNRPQVIAKLDFGYSSVYGGTRLYTTVCEFFGYDECKERFPEEYAVVLTYYENDVTFIENREIGL